MRKRTARFRVLGWFDGAGKGTVEIDAHDVFRARPQHRRRTFELPLGRVADMVIMAVAKAEVAAQQKQKKAKRRSRVRRGLL